MPSGRASYKWALRTAEMLADYDVAWFEEPLPPDALEDYVRLRRAARVPIAGGEVLTRRQSFQPWLEAGAFDIVQPDVTKVRRHQRRTAHRVDGSRTRRSLHPARLEHGGRPGGGSATRLGLSGTDLVEYLTGSPFIDGLRAGGWQLDADGMLAIPDGPGLGIDLNLDALAEFSRTDVADTAVSRCPSSHILWVAFAMNYVDRQMVYTMFPALKADLGFAGAKLGLIGSVFHVGLYAVDAGGRKAGRYLAAGCVAPLEPGAVERRDAGCADGAIGESFLVGVA